MKNNTLLDIQPEVKAALDAGRAVVALESTIISHGMPYPQNIQMAKKVESIIRSAGAVPATVAIMDGKIKIGLSDQELEVFASSKNVAKVSRRDFPGIIARKQLGATTVATTMYAAHLAGIKVFVTGGIGGVHRGYEETIDVSADLEELAQTDVVVVCAGAKAILDLPRTMEYLETKGVPVIGYKTDVLPAFFSAKSDIHLVERADTPEEIARIIVAKAQLEMSGGLLVANPIPEEYSLDHEFIDQVIEQAVKAAQEQGVSGKNITPFLLSEITKRTEGKSLAANLELVYNNALVGAQIASALAAELEQQ
ncbi:MAG TPA: pseudouridine-5'-phosphate glycosidase [Anaerolineaceae bacterium]|nr:pseudouridine-5'-phosphate glycosidase [Anaerolineaceae bacterium]